MQTLPQFFADALREPRERAFAERLGRTEWTFTSSTRMLERASALGAALRAAGVTHGDRVALIANNRVDWIAADLGILFAGAVCVPIFATLALDQIEFIFADSGAKLCFVETTADAVRLNAACPSAPRFIAFDGDGLQSLADFEAGGLAAAQADPAWPAVFDRHTTSEELGVLIYTSGTTGNPKGVMLSHGNLTSNASDSFGYGFTTIERGDDVLSVLPFAHIYEHTDVLGFVKYGCNLYVTRPEHLVADMQSVRPRTMALVPRIYERVLAGVVGKSKAAGGLQARLVPWALETGRSYMASVQDGKRAGGLLSLRYALARSLVLRKIKPALGLDRAEFFVSGSAPLHRDIALTFASFGLPICEGYGLTETSPVVSVNRNDSIRYGSVGRPIPGVAVRIASDGEIEVKGPNVMQGYYHLPDERPFTDDGWFKTGDIGMLDADGFLFITDRKKELMKTTGGKYLAPGRIEAAIKRSLYVAQVFVIGDGRAHPAALVAPNWDLVRKHFALDETLATAQIAKREDVRELIQKEVATHTADLASFEQVRRIALLPRELTIEDGELSPTLKVKRRVVEGKFADIIESAYAESAAPVPA